LAEVPVDHDDLLDRPHREHRSITNPMSSHAPHGLPVSIVMPAHNAAATIGESIQSVLSQTSPHWELVIVDDGSVDATGAVVDQAAARDSRIRSIRQPQQSGVSNARNLGTSSACFDWVLYLDADDWLAPTHLEKMTTVLAQNPPLDGVYCGWVRVTPDGRRVDEQFYANAGGLFETLTRYCAFSVHACIVRRALIAMVGGWDTSLRTCEDWDLWLRIARTGAQFAALHEFLAEYRMRPDSASLDGFRYVADGLRVIHQAHSPDPRVRDPHWKYAAGASASRLANAVFSFVNWPAGLVLGSGGDARPLLDAITVDLDPGLDPRAVAKSILESALLPSAKPPDAWPELWPTVESRLDEFLAALEARSGAPALARRTRTWMERCMVDGARLPSPVDVGRLHARRIEITAPLHDICLRATTERLMCAVDLEGEGLGSLDLPVTDTVVPHSLLADALAKFWWTILGRFLARTVHKELRVTPNETGCAVARGALCLIEHLDQGEVVEQIHALAGWLLFLQELWGRPCWPLPWFYSEETPDGHAPVQRVGTERVALEISAELPAFACESELNLDVRLGGVSLGWLAFRSARHISPQQVRVRITRAVGQELGRVAVREALLGRPLVGGGTLRERLARAADARRPPPSVTTSNVTLESAAHETAKRALHPAGGVVLPRRAVGATGTSASRRALFPVAARQDLIEAAVGRGEVPIHVKAETTSAQRVVYAPDLICRQSTALVIDSPPRGPVGDRAPSSTSLPILMYHHVENSIPGTNAEYCLSPAAFEAQLRFLRDTGFYSITLEDWRVASEGHQPLRARPIVITFDDGYLNFKRNAWPLLKQYGFSAMVFVVTGEVGGSNRWDIVKGNGSIPLLGWDDVRGLRDEGVEFGSHSVTHSPLTGLTHRDVIREATRSQMALEKALSRTVLTFAYPYGDTDEVVQHWIGACGYTFGLSCLPGEVTFGDPLLALPRIEIAGTDTIEDLARKLHL
jgi:peptidoglycan/xylan/chitin deacetylase (PgdA/CDA1 family)